MDTGRRYRKAGGGHEDPAGHVFNGPGDKVLLISLDVNVWKIDKSAFPPSDHKNNGKSYADHESYQHSSDDGQVRKGISFSAAYCSQFVILKW
jgi:hypothetical protein